MTSLLIRGVLDYWREALVALGIVAAIGWYHDRAELHRAQGARDVYAERFTASVQRADSLDKLRAEADSQALAAAVRISRLRAEADSLREASEVAAHEASIRATQAGDSLTATLESLARVVPPELRPLTATAQRQHTEEVAAYRDVAEALESQLANTVKLREAADSTTRIWERRYGASEEAREAAVRALSTAREAIDAGSRNQGGGRTWQVVGVAAAVASGYIAAKLMQ